MYNNAALPAATTQGPAAPLLIQSAAPKASSSSAAEPKIG
jgi:hypothetical protein